jgi:hypothetical protein
MGNGQISFNSVRNLAMAGIKGQLLLCWEVGHGSAWPHTPLAPVHLYSIPTLMLGSSPQDVHVESFFVEHLVGGRCTCNGFETMMQFMSALDSNPTSSSAVTLFQDAF